MPFPDIARRPEIHGHRGCRGLQPENTLPAFLRALTLGVDVLELDVVISADQQVVVSHEPWLSAQLGTGPAGQDIDPLRERDYNLYRLPYATIRQCVVGNKAHPNFPGQQLVASYRPLLREVIAAVEAACRRLGRLPVKYSVELKSSSSGDNLFHPPPAVFVELILTELRAASVLPRTTLLSFDQRILQAAHQAADYVPVCLLSETSVTAPELFSKLDFVPDAFGPDFRLLSQDVVQGLLAHFPALQLVPWTVNEEADLKRVLDWPVAGITTDYPDRLRELLF